MPAFNPGKLQGVRMPVWITLKNVPEEFLSSAQDMVTNIRVMLGWHKGNPHNTDQRFYIVVKTTILVDMVLEAVNPMSDESTLIQVDYNNLPIHCRSVCLLFILLENAP